MAPTRGTPNVGLLGRGVSGTVYIQMHGVSQTLSDSLHIVLGVWTLQLVGHSLLLSRA